MATTTELGGIDITVKADREGIVRAFKEGGRAAASQIVGGAARGQSGAGGLLGPIIGKTPTGAKRGGGGSALKTVQGLLKGGVKGFIGGITKIVGKIGIPGLILAAALGVAAKAVSMFAKTVKRVISNFNREFERLAQVSATLAAALGKSQIKNLFRDLKRARALAPIMLKVKSGLSELKDILAPLRNALSFLALSALESVIRALNLFAEILTQAAKVVGLVLAMVLHIANNSTAIRALIMGLFSAMLGPITGTVIGNQFLIKLERIEQTIIKALLIMEESQDPASQQFNQWARADLSALSGVKETVLFSR